MKLFEVISPQNRGRMGALGPLVRLIEAVANWTTNIHTTSASDKRIIQQSIPKFKYTGTMYRIVFVYDNGDLTDTQKIKNHIVQNKHGINLMSWSKTMKGIEHWNMGIPDGDGEESLEDNLEGDEVRVMEVLITQQGTGFDVEAFHQHAEANREKFAQQGAHRLIDHKMGIVRRAADIKEVAAPLSNRFDIKITDETEIDYSDDDREYIRQQRAAERSQ